MQWKNDHNGGFSAAPSPSLCRAVVEGEFGPENVNVADQRRDPESLLTWMEQVIRRRREIPELGWGESRVIDGGADSILVHRSEWSGAIALLVHNFSATRTKVRLALADLGLPRGQENFLVDLLADRRPPALDGDTVEFMIEGYGHRWFRVESEGNP